MDSDTDMSLDSLEIDRVKNRSNINRNLKTILVPFYERDVLIKIPKDRQKSNMNSESKKSACNKISNDANSRVSYLVNYNKEKKKASTYLEKFRMKFPQLQTDNKKDSEVGSLYPEYGDSERESIHDDTKSPRIDFYNTEPYNEIFYDKILNEQYYSSSVDNSIDEDINVEDCLQTPNINNLKSVSEVNRRQSRKMQPLPNTTKLGGLGPDMEKIRPRLERARSLQRYSEKVRMDNRVKIYKSNLQAESDKKMEQNKKVNSAKKQRADTNKTRNVTSIYEKASYLMNKTVTKKEESTTIGKISFNKTKTGNIYVTDAKNTNKTDKIEKVFEKKLVKNKEQEKPKSAFSKQKNIDQSKRGNRCKSRCSDKTIESKNAAINTDSLNSPVQINFHVNVGSVGGVRPSSALRRLEEKHRMYQERVKDFTTDFTTFSQH